MHFLQFMQRSNKIPICSFFGSWGDIEDWIYSIASMCYGCPQICWWLFPIGKKSFFGVTCNLFYLLVSFLLTQIDISHEHWINSCYIILHFLLIYRVFRLNNYSEWHILSSLHLIFICWLLVHLLSSLQIQFILEKILGCPEDVTMDWRGAPTGPNSCIIKKILRLEIPVDTCPNVCHSSPHLLWCCFFLVCNTLLLCVI